MRTDARADIATQTGKSTSAPIANHLRIGSLAKCLPVSAAQPEADAFARFTFQFLDLLCLQGWRL